MKELPGGVRAEIQMFITLSAVFRWQCLLYTCTTESHFWTRLRPKRRSTRTFIHRSYLYVLGRIDPSDPVHHLSRLDKISYDNIAQHNIILPITPRPQVPHLSYSIHIDAATLRQPISSHQLQFQFEFRFRFWF
jgi:hypothetical protein